MDLIANAIRAIPDFPKPGILFRDITTLLNNPEAFKASIDQFVDRYRDQNIDAVVGIESRGFIFGSVVAYCLNCGVVPIRKKGKLPAETYRETYSLEYGEDTIEIHRDALSSGSRIVLIDDLLATGGTMSAAVRLIKQFSGVEVVEAAFLIELADLNGRALLEDTPVFSVIQY